MLVTTPPTYKSNETFPESSRQGGPHTAIFGTTTLSGIEQAQGCVWHHFHTYSSRNFDVWCFGAYLSGGNNPFLALLSEGHAGGSSGHGKGPMHASHVCSPSLA